MSLRAIAVASLVTLIGAAALGGVYWTLLNVPESNVLALVLSALLVVLLLLLAGYVLAVVLDVGRGSPLTRALKAGWRGLPGFLAGLVVFSLLSFVTLRIGDSWRMHAGEIDALFLRYAGSSNSAWLHTSVSWLLWLLRWGLGSAMVAGLTASGVRRMSLPRGFGLAFSPVPLLSTVGGVLSTYGLWTLAYWRPKGLPADSAELAFVSVKLALLVGVCSVITALVLRAFMRADDADARTTPPVSSRP